MTDKIIFRDHGTTEAQILEFAGETRKEAAEALNIPYEYFIRVMNKHKLTHIFSDIPKPSKDKNRVTIYVRPSVVEVFGGHKPSVVINLASSRNISLAAAIDYLDGNEKKW